MSLTHIVKTATGQSIDNDFRASNLPLGDRLYVALTPTLTRVDEKRQSDNV